MICDNKCDICLNTKINIGIHENVSDPDSKEDNLSWTPYKDLKIINTKITSEC